MPGVLSLSVENAATLRSERNLAPALAGAISSMVGVSQNRVLIKDMRTQRRLDDRIDAEARKLAQTLRVDFTVVAENTATAAAVGAVLSQTVPAAMQSRVDASLASHGVQHTVLVYDVQYVPRNGPAPATSPFSQYWERAPSSTAAPTTGDDGMSTVTIAMASVGGALGLITVLSSLLCIGYYVRGGSSAKTAPSKHLQAQGVHAAPAVGPDTKAFSNELVASKTAASAPGHQLSNVVESNAVVAAGKLEQPAGLNEDKLRWVNDPNPIRRSHTASTVSSLQGGNPRNPSVRSSGSLSTGISRDGSSDYSQKARYSVDSSQRGRAPSRRDASGPPSLSSSRSGQHSVRRQTSQGRPT